MKTAYIFPGQASQFPGMGKDMYEESEEARELFDLADEILGFPISNVMFRGTKEELKQTDVTQPAVFLYSVIKFLIEDEVNPRAVAGHSLGEYSALVAANVLSFEDGLRLVKTRSQAMQKACETTEGTMSAILGLDNEIIEKACSEIDGIVVPANYNCPGQLVISGEIEAIKKANEKLTELGARRALMLPVGGAFHSPLMESARAELEKHINDIEFRKPIAPIYQNVNAIATTSRDEIKKNLVSQLTSPVRWTQTVENMIADGMMEFVEVGAKVLSGFVKKVDKTKTIESI